MGCFKVANDLTELHDLTGEVKWDNMNEAVRKCAKLAKDEGFTLFALGKGGVCLSGSDMRDKYLDNGTENAQCHNGIGIEDSMFVYSLGKHCHFLFFSLSKPDEKSFCVEYHTAIHITHDKWRILIGGDRNL